jgi:hypothetical protein
MKFINQHGGGGFLPFLNPFDIFEDEDDDEDDIEKLIYKLENSDDLHPIEVMQIIIRLRKLGVNVS